MYVCRNTLVPFFPGPLALRWDERRSRVFRKLEIGVNWYHLNGNVSIGDWRDCPDLYCPPLTIKAGDKDKVCTLNYTTRNLYEQLN